MHDQLIYSISFMKKKMQVKDSLWFIYSVSDAARIRLKYSVKSLQAERLSNEMSLPLKVYP